MTTLIGSTRQLFLDDRIIEVTENVRRRLHRPVRQSENPVLRADRAWEEGGSGVDIAGGTVLFDADEGLFKMWYRTNQAILEKTSDGTVREATGAAYVSCYAVSEDGLGWEKPSLGLTEFRGTRGTNMLPAGTGGRNFIRRPNVIKDYDEADPTRRYKMVYLDEIGERFGLAKAYSSDGIQWRMNASPPTFFERPVIPNGILFGWDPKREEYVLYHRNVGTERADVDGRMVRSDLRRVVRSASKDFEQWGDTTIALELDSGDPDELDVGHLGILSGVIYTDDLYVGILDTCTVRGVEDVPEALWDPVYKMDHAEHRQELVMSRDGLRWTRVAPHWEFFRPGFPGTWDSGHVIPSKPIVYGDRIHIYYCGYALSCKSYLPTAPQTAALYAVGLASLRLDGFVSMEGYDPGGWLRTRLLVFAGDRLVVNARAPRSPFRPQGADEVVFEGDRTWTRPLAGAGREPAAGSESPFGTLRVGFEDADGKPIPGFTAADCDPFTGDNTGHVMSWAGRSDLSALAGRPVRLRFELFNAALYAFEFNGGRVEARLLDRGSPGSRGAPRRA